MRYVNLVLLLIICLGNSCKNPVEGIDLLVDADGYDNSPVSIVFLNANGDSSTPLGSFEVKISGKSGESILNEVGEKEFSTVEGVLMLTVDRGVLASESNPVEFNLYAKVAGFVAASETIKITNNNPTSFVVKLVEYAKPPEGTVALTKTQPLVNGISTGEKYTLPISAGKEEKATIEMQTGTQILDNTGAPILASSMQTEIVHFGTGTEVSFEAFPGGFQPGNILDENGNRMGDGSFISAGFFAINMTAGGKSVKSFSKPMKVDVEVSETLENPETGELLKVGDRIPLWSLDEVSGQWQHEGVAVVNRNSSGKLHVVFEVGHLSYWNLDFWGARCSQPPSINIIANGNAGNRNYRLKLVTSSGQPLTNYATTSRFLNRGNNVITLANSPNLNARLEVYDLSTGKNVASSNLFNLCSGGVTVNIQESAIPASIVADIRLRGQCPSNSFSANLYSWIYIYEVDNRGWWIYRTALYLRDGRSQIRLSEGAKYKIVTYSNGKSYYTDFTFSKTNIQLPAIKGLTGSITYNASSNVAFIDALYTFDKCK